ncbi:MAG: hypothetical protein CL455_08230 [Acidimicrobiaceae bacterium]|nr:hypothetical protein [Acidimicrobiaceae bacterium]
MGALRITKTGALYVVDCLPLCDDVCMPLSEDEQRILSQIEQQLHESDPGLAKEVATTTVYTHSARNIKWSVLGFIVGLVTIVLTLSVSFWLAFVGFAMMLTAALFFEQNLRRLGRAGMNQLSMNVRSGSLRNYDSLRRRKLWGIFPRRDETGN